MNPNTFDHSTLPPTLSEKPANLSSQSSSIGGDLSAPKQNIYQRIRSKFPKKDVFKKHFGRSFGTGKSTTLKSYGGGMLGGKRIEGLKTAMHAFRRNRSGSGQNLSKKDIEYFSKEIGDSLKRHPTGKSYDDKTQHISVREQKKLKRKFQSAMKGKISRSDYNDVKRMIKNIQV